MENEVQCITPTQKTITTKRGDVIVRELVIEDIAVISSELLALFQTVPAEDLQKSNLAVITQMLRKGGLIQAVQRILAQVTDKDEKFYCKFPIVSFAKVVFAFLEINPPKELRDLFFEIKARVTQATA